LFLFHSPNNVELMGTFCVLLFWVYLKKINKCI
jgi:hypothetical protein